MRKLLFLSVLLLATAGFAATPSAVRSVADSPDVIGGGTDGTDDTTAAAVEKVTVSYKGESEALTPFERGFAEFSDLRYYEVHLDGKRTLASLTEIVCTGGETTEKEMISEDFPLTGVSALCFYAQGISADSVKIMIRTDGGFGLSTRTVQLPNNKHYILMETYDAERGGLIRGEDEDASDLSVEYVTGSEIPLIAYTTGLSREFEFDGQKGTLIDYCGLRDKHIHPARWHDELGIDNYVYYVAKFQ